jgi:hypothetical protein
MINLNKLLVFYPLGQELAGAVRVGARWPLCNSTGIGPGQRGVGNQAGNRTAAIQIKNSRVSQAQRLILHFKYLVRAWIEA